MNSFLENRPVSIRTAGMPPAIPKSEPGFHSLIPHDATFKPTPTPVSAPTPAPRAETEPVPQVELVQNGGKVERIIVTCTCCNRIELQCQY